MAVHREEPYRDARRTASLRHSEDADDRTLILPLYPGLSEADQDYVVAELRMALAESDPA